MTFTDDDLKRLKDNLSSVQGYSIVNNVWKLPALLTRLEAVERYAKCMRAEHPGWYNPQYKVWRKAAGK